ncbi:MAG TPA: nucleotide disphospho-sugar-binding domain-containing protein, partial [Methylomirabilota bacterium]|nr:nucleotide disphospho-sugar-binding domain-containing protein [Methylomirabilota bacterium]
VTSPALLMPRTLDCEFVRVLDALRGARAAIFDAYGVAGSFGCWDYLSPWVNVVFALPELVGAGAELPPATVLVGPSIYPDREDESAAFPWERLDGRPLVYASFGTVWYCQPDLFRMIAEAAASLDVQLVLTLGALAGTDYARTLPGDPIGLPYTPQLRVLERAAVCISHGGANTVMESLYYGVPLFVIPLCTDQPVNGFFVERAGAGVSILPAKVTTEACRRALAALLPGDSPYRTTARRIQAAYRKRDGAREAARRIVEVLGRRERATV